MPGFRLGYMLAREDIIEKAGLLIETTVSCFPEFIQWAGIEALRVEEYKMKELKKRRDLMVELINKLPELCCDAPKGGIYCWARVLTMSSERYFKKALEKGVVVCPGEVFGRSGYVRFCFAKPIKEIKEGFKRLE